MLFDVGTEETRAVRDEHPDDDRNARAHGAVPAGAPSSSAPLPNEP
jgi:hypothetical protein